MGSNWKILKSLPPLPPQFPGFCSLCGSRSSPPPAAARWRAATSLWARPGIRLRPHSHGKTHCGYRPRSKSYLASLKTKNTDVLPACALLGYAVAFLLATYFPLSPHPAPPIRWLDCHSLIF